MTPLLKSYVPLVKHQPSSPSSCADRDRADIKFRTSRRDFASYTAERVLCHFILFYVRNAMECRSNKP